MDKNCGNCALYTMSDGICYTFQEQHYPGDEACFAWENYEDHLKDLRDYYKEHPKAKAIAIKQMREENEKALRYAMRGIKERK